MDDTQKIVNIIVTHAAQFTMSQREVEHLVTLLAREFDYRDWRSLRTSVLLRLKPKEEA